MNSPSEAWKKSLVQPLPDLGQLSTILGHAGRWKMLKAMTSGEPRTISELAAAGGCSYESTMKHLAVMRAAGVIEQRYGRLHNIPKQYLPAPGEPLVDFGHCLLRLDAGE
jgi:predicted transcriptional regulator